MDRVMVATNAGADARVLHVAALRRASEVGASLFVVHVIGGSEYEAQPEQLRSAIRAETEWLLHTMLGLASDRAGVEPVDVVIRVLEGTVADELVAAVASGRPARVMLGIPRSSDTSQFNEAEFQDLVGRIEAVGVPVEQVPTA